MYNNFCLRQYFSAYLSTFLCYNIRACQYLQADEIRANPRSSTNRYTFKPTPFLPQKYNFNFFPQRVSRATHFSNHVIRNKNDIFFTKIFQFWNPNGLRSAPVLYDPLLQWGSLRDRDCRIFYLQFPHRLLIETIYTTFFFLPQLAVPKYFTVYNVMLLYYRLYFAPSTSLCFGFVRAYNRLYTHAVAGTEGESVIDSSAVAVPSWFYIDLKTKIFHNIL